MDRALILKKIYDRLAKCETAREECIMRDKDFSNLHLIEYIDEEIKALRLTLQDIMNSVCPLIKDERSL